MVRIVLTVLFISLVAGCAAPSDVSDTPAAAAEGAGATELARGCTKTACVDLTESTYEWLDCTGTYSCAADGKTFAVVHAVLKNTGAEAVNTNPYNFRLVTSDVVMDADGATYASDDAMKSNDVRPGGTARGDLAFEVDTGTKVEAFCFQTYTKSFDKIEICMPMAATAP